MALHARTSSLVFYGVGNIPSQIIANLLGAPLFFYYNNVLGLNAWLVSLALAIAVIIDAFVDPLVGYVSDYTRSRLGRRHPFIIAGILPGALFYWLLPNMHAGAGQNALFWQLLLLMTGLRISWSFYQVPREALGAEIVKDYQQRTQLNGVNSFFGWIGGAAIGYVTAAYFLKDSYSNAAGYVSLAHWGALVILIAGAIFVLGTAREIPSLEAPRLRPKGLAAIAAEVKETLNHRSWLMMFFAGLVFSIYVGLTTGLGFYFNSYFWNWKPSDVAIFGLIDMVAALTISLNAGVLARNFDKKRLAVVLFVISIVIGPLLLVLRLADIHFGLTLLPANGPKFGPLWWVMMAHSLASASVGALAWILVGSMTADVVEDSQRKTGKRSEGLFFAGPQLIQKCVSGIGQMIKGLILTYVGFSAAAPLAAKVAAIQDLALVILGLAVVLPSISLYLLSKYEITRGMHDENLRTLGYAGDGAADVTGDDPQPLVAKYPAVAGTT